QNLGFTRFERDEPLRALDHLEESIRLFGELGSNHLLGDSLVGVAAIIDGAGNSEAAAAALGAAETMVKAQGTELGVYERHLYDRTVAAVRGTLAAYAFEAATARGRAEADDAMAGGDGQSAVA